MHNWIVTIDEARLLVSKCGVMHCMTDFCIVYVKVRRSRIEIVPSCALLPSFILPLPSLRNLNQGSIEQPEDGQEQRRRSNRSSV